MDIAYYDNGNIKDPLGKIHDKKGKPLLQEDEVILIEDNAARCTVIETRNPRTWGIVWGGKIVFEDVGTGTFYRTDERFIFLRKPLYSKHMLGSSLARLDEASERALLAKEWARTHKLECFSVPVQEIRKVKRRKGKSVLAFVEDKNARYRIRITSAVASRL